jgi:hypothetical protein
VSISVPFAGTIRSRNVISGTNIIEASANVLQLGQGANSYNIFLNNTTRVFNMGTSLANIFYINNGVTNFLKINTSGVIQTETANYENFVTNPNDIANRKFLFNNFDAVLFSQIATVTRAVNTTNEENILSTYSLPANYATIEGVMKVTFEGLFNHVLGTTYIFRVYLGGTLIGFTDSINPNNATNEGFRGDLYVSFRTIGASGTVICGGDIRLNEQECMLKNGSASGTASLSPTTVNTTISQQIRVTVQPSVANAGNAINTLKALIQFQQ